MSILSQRPRRLHWIWVPFVFLACIGSQAVAQEDHVAYTFTTRQKALTILHPDYALSSLFPKDMPNKIVGMDWLPNGDMAILTLQDNLWPHDNGGHGWVHVLSGAREAPATPPQVRTVYYGFEHPMGLAVAQGNIHVSQRESLVRLWDSDQNGEIDSLVTVAPYPDSKLDGGWGRWALNVRYHAGKFYTGLGAYHFNYEPGPCMPWPERGLVHIVDTAGQIELRGRGLREPNGIGFGTGLGADAEVFATDNDGEWVAANRLVHVRKDEFYGLVPCKAWDPSLEHTLPAIWFPRYLRSPGQPLSIPGGPFQGQFLVGDYTVRNLSRIDLEKVNGRYQGAIFPFSGGIASGGIRLLSDESGAIYIGQLTIENYQGWWVDAPAPNAPGALEKLSPKATTAFEMRSIKALSDGFEIEFTRPASRDAAMPASYRITQWRLQSTAGYGSPDLDRETLEVTTASLSEDALKADLRIAGLKTNRVVHIQLFDGFRAANGDLPWTYEAWYTLNAIPGLARLHREFPAARNHAPFSMQRFAGGQMVLLSNQPFACRMILSDLRGRLLGETRMPSHGQWNIPAGLKPGLYALTMVAVDGEKKGQFWKQTVLLP